MADKPTLTISDIANMDAFALTPTDVARTLNCDRRTVTKGIDSGTIPSVRIGRRILVPRLPFLEMFGAATAAPAHE
ncbi:hypothetical protein CH304_20155 [Rhodococcus sp. 15-649-1-2]|nr:helix-turn-helix domain-containing protein [Rhodococcus sp. 15-649-1-2]OZE79287.1 hypothetical protein CH304_20155 [Rhodococcus sp. 15-649-1-2]